MRGIEQIPLFYILEHVRSTHPTMAGWQDAIQPAWTLISGGCHPNRDTEATRRRSGFRDRGRWSAQPPQRPAIRGPSAITRISALICVICGFSVVGGRRG